MQEGTDPLQPGQKLPPGTRERWHNYNIHHACCISHASGLPCPASRTPSLTSTAAARPSCTALTVDSVPTTQPWPDPSASKRRLSSWSVAVVCKWNITSLRMIHLCPLCSVSPSCISSLWKTRASPQHGTYLCNTLLG